ncbi:DNA recombination-mediator protein A [Limnoglobus roseus]|uniref:DNA recombination-mediator protein A n=1 Tax=Limnoglobus roseus TaxID=2598579 RepID=A0A5C1AAX7_9BACT|nr:DNA recombination-mediator protein A [Limnoglobus roseus]
MPVEPPTGSKQDVSDGFSPVLRDHLKLALVPGLGPKLTAALLEHFGSPAAALKATYLQLLAIPLIGDKLARSFSESFRTVDVGPESELLVKHGVRPVVLGEADYPTRLTTLVGPPGLLYLRGTLTAADANAVGIVGSRACTAYGKRIAERIAAGLARAGWTVISGLARGIDGAAHRGALDAGGRTIAVLAGGLAKIYPPEHTSLADDVAKQGCLVSETPMTVAPLPGMFPARNRIISGLSRAVVVVEANVKSGALITVDHAAEQGREVFVVPGPVDSPASAGCLELIRKGAKLVRDADDILEDLRGIAPPDAAPPRRPAAANPTPSLFEPPMVPAGLDAVQQKIWDALDGTPKHADELSRLTGAAISQLTSSLMQLELKKLIRRLPGNQYERRR